MKKFNLFGLFGRKNDSKKSSALTEREGNLPVKAEKIRLSDTERRLKELEKKNNPQYKEAYVPYYDSIEAQEEEVKNPRYQKIASNYRILKWSALFVLALYCVGMVILFRDQITIENFRFLMRNVDFEADTGIVLENDIVYVADEQSVFAKYREYLAVVSTNKLTVYDTNGSIAHSEDISYNLPCVSVSEKYLLVYDKKGCDYSVYTYFDRENAETLDYPVSHAALSDSGIYALATRSKDYQGVVYIYSSSFKLMNRIMKNKSISAIDITDKGDEVLVCAYYTDEYGRTVTEITALPTSTSESRLLFTVENTMVYSCCYLDNGGFVLVCDDGLRFYGSDGKQTQMVSYNGINVNKYITDRNGVLLVGALENGSADNIAFFYDAGGKSIGELKFDADYTDIEKDGEYIYVLYSDRLLKMSLEKSEKYSIKSGLIPVDIAAGGGNVFVCTSGVAYVPEREEDK